MIYTVTWNPALDYILHVENLTKGKIQRTNKEELYPGGKGINVSLVLSEFGIDNIAMGFLAGFTGREIERLLKDKGCETKFIYTKEGMSRINVKIRDNEETDINTSGPVIAKENIDGMMNTLSNLKEDDFLVLAGSIPATLSSNTYEMILESLALKGVKTVVDAEGELLRKVLPYHPFLIKPNEEELKGLFSVNITKREEVIYYAEKLQELGARNVLVSLGEKGAIFLTEEKETYQMEAVKGEVRNTVGAGDAMLAGFLAGYFKTGDFRKAFELSVQTGSASAFSDWLPTKELYPQIFMDK
ncbi:1-phosphofructokinase [Lachnoclostridium phytofermentans]|uniref:Tagatose-6-phosphate kinase n=1 Tax=Lachnoclostridium phytofermentans (strain ATCC 700394 / DSM 18823 / ISDg) TaxID=357809 RepID=A9KL99_LACP7|nr:1-phosphofructokinase [Lachnoclostridium phytofermentans]ABX44248.1 1-phosphofructokinase [Lachnoclostridium phytofermentans ISDg]